MIIDSLRNAHRYFSVHPLFEKAFNYIQQADLKNANDERVDVADGLKAIFSNAPGKTKQASMTKFECHNKNIDIQLCIDGVETIGWKPRQACKDPNGDYNPEKDVLFYHDRPDMFFQLTNLQFAIFFPEDVHAPMIGDGNIRKLVMKVRV